MPGWHDMTPCLYGARDAQDIAALVVDNGDLVGDVLPLLGRRAKYPLTQGLVHSSRAPRTEDAPNGFACGRFGWRPFRGLKVAKARSSLTRDVWS